MNKDVFGGVFDRVAGVYDTSGVEFFKPVARRLVEHLTVAEGERVLDIGCGRGAVLFPLTWAVGPTGSVTGIDLSPAMVAATSAEVAASGADNLRVLEMDGQAPEFEPGAFDVITGSMSIIMIPDLPTAFGNYVKLLRPGGRLGMTIPVPPADMSGWQLGPLDLGRLFREVDPEVLAKDDSMVRFVRGEVFETPATVVAKLRAAGFVDVVEHSEQIRLVAARPEDLVAWTQSHGMRVFWDCIPEQRRELVERELAAEVADRAGGSGPVSAEFPISYVVARTPTETWSENSR